MRLHCLVALAFVLPVVARAEITLIGTATIPGTAHDLSGLTGNIPAADGTPTTQPRDQFGSAGSDIAYTGRGDEYLQVNDRGPADGATRFECRGHLVKIVIHPGAATPVTVSLEKTFLLRNEEGEAFVGAANAFVAGADKEDKSMRLDPEGVRVAGNGRDFFISDEYGPFIWKFSAEGKRVARLTVPEKFLIAQRSDSADQETKLNESGRQTNRGMEGLAMTPDGTKLVGLMQSPLIQDGGVDAELNRVGTNCRILEVEIATGKTREFLYPLEDAKLGTNEILAINEHAFLVIERDSKTGKKAVSKKIFRIDLGEATDISGVEKLPVTGVPAGIKAVSKTLFLDLLDPKYKLAGENFPEKIEGLAFGPDVGGDHTLVITNDNDLIPAVDNRYYVFSVPAADLPGYAPQRFERR